MINSFNNILILAPHTDDGELGCGGTIDKLIKAGKKVTYVAFSTCEESVPKGLPKDTLAKEVKEAVRILGIPKEDLIIKNYTVRYFKNKRQEILEDLVVLNRLLKPDLVFCPATTDIHQDHQTIAEEAIRAFKNTSILGYEFIWNSFEQKTNLFVNLEEDNLKKKIESLKAYASQGFRSYTSEDSIRTVAKYKGFQIKRDLAEAFEVIRLITK